MKHKYFIFLMGILFIAECIVNPVGDFPLNDDWTYGKSTLMFKNEGRVDVGDFAAMTLFTHIIWGFLFTKVFGFSFTILRLSTLVSTAIAMFVLNKLVLSITNNQKISFLACLTLLLNPIYFNLSNTFMTDVNFNTLLLLCCYFAFDFFRTSNKTSFVLVFVMSILLVLIRQFGIIVPACFTFVCLFRVEKKWLYLGFCVLGSLAVYGALKYYENYLKGILLDYSAYKFSGGVDLMSKSFWDLFKYNCEVRYKQILLHVILYSFPFAIIFLRRIITGIHWIALILVGLFSIWLVDSLFKEVPFPIGNIFANMNLGTETFYESLHPEFKNTVEHTFSSPFQSVAMVVKYVFLSFTIAIILLAIVQWFKAFTNPFRGRLELLFLVCLFGAYTFMILITESYFDRYHIPLITFTLIMLSYIGRRYQGEFSFAILPLLLFFYVSIFGTKDYLELNRKRWEAYYYVKEKENTTVDKINGGFEVNCWNDAKHSWWYDFFSLDNYDYLIQYRKDLGFKIYKEYEFQRYFPYKKDTLFIYVREKTE